jgi:MSHA biogenesis protein MshL
MRLPVKAAHIRWICGATLIALAGCGPMPVAKSDNHIASDEKGARHAAAAPSQSIPAPVKQVPLPPTPMPKAAELRYSVVVNEVPVREVLFAIAKETKLNIDIHPGIEGKVTLNAVDQTIRQIFTRLAKQVDMRWEADGPNISVMPDTPFLKMYPVNYVNVARDMAAGVNVSTQTTGGLGGGSATPGQIPAPPPNTSVFVVGNSSKNRFWETLEKNIKDLLRETDKLLPEGSSETFVRRQGPSTATTLPRTGQSGGQTSSSGSQPSSQNASSNVNAELSAQTLTFREAASVIVNPETGILTIRATSRQHEKVAEFLSLVAGSAKRQVLIEATVVEVTLNDNYQSGIDWSTLALEGLGYSIRQGFASSVTANTETGSTPFSIAYSNPNAAAGGSISSTIRLLNTFGNSKVLSSPKIMALNNQMSLLKVITNEVYFEVSASTQQNQTQSQTNFTTIQRTVPVGFVMYVTPQISDNDTVLLNVRPVVSRKVRDVDDPNPSLRIIAGNQTSTIPNKIPVVETREMESVLSLASGQTAILGGMMMDSTVNSRDGLPILSRIPVLGDAVSYRNDRNQRTELVIFIRPVVIRDASLETDLLDYKKYLPDGKFFKDADPLIPELVPPFKMKPNPVVPDAMPPKS